MWIKWRVFLPSCYLKGEICVKEREEEKVCSELYNSVTEWVEYPKEKYLECKNLKLENFES